MPALFKWSAFLQKPLDSGAFPTTIRGILEDLEIETTLKERIGAVLFSNLSIKKKRIAIRKLKKYKLEPKFVKMFLNLLEYIDTV